MSGPSSDLSHEETSRLMAEMERQWRDAGDGEKERLAWVSNLLVGMLAKGVLSSVENDAGDACSAGKNKS